MKKLIVAVVLSMFGIVPAFADTTPTTVDVPTVVSTLIDHIHAQVIEDTKGRTRFELTDAIIQAVPYKGGYLVEGQAGFSGTTTPGKGESIYQHFVASVFLPINPYLGNVINFTPNYALLKQVQFGPVYGYDFSERHGYFGIQANLAFGLTPAAQ